MVQIQSYTKQMEKLAETDMLTGILNRRGFFETVDVAFRQDIRAKKTPGIIFCDVNGLKKVNDHFGHEVGDQMIMDTASILSNVFKNDVLARMGGDEFVIYISECSFSLLEHINFILNERINQFNMQNNTVYQLSLEAGVACYDETNHSSLDVLIKEADQNLYTKKRFRKINF
ncbi:MAG: GGDEF domain-containing protein [Erysipelotrichaceae bacterium]|nr:GGDEF domain-containing protein [Erysipelotrichaceae bacterium]